MSNETETLANSINTTADSAIKEVKTLSVHPAVGVVGVSTIGGFLGTIVAGPLGAILGGTLGVLGASIENTKSGKSGYYTNRNRSRSMRSTQPFGAIATEMTQARKEIAQDIDEVAGEIQQGASNLASNAQATAEKLGDKLSDLTGSNHSTLKGILLDIDGTLVLSNNAHAYAWVEAFAAFGYDIKFEQVRPLIGMGGDQVVPRLVSELSGDEGVGKQIADRRKELIINKFGADLSSAPGSRDLILRLKQEGFKLVVASSATSEELSVLLKAAQVDDLLTEEPKTTSDDADNSKPAPDLVQSALKKGKLESGQAIMLGDTPYDIQAANAAGVNVIAFRCGDFDDSQLSGALAIYDNPADLLTQFERSPLTDSEAVAIEL